MAGPRTTLTPARRAIVEQFAALSDTEQSALRALAHGARMDIWDYLERKGWGAGHTFSAAPGTSPSSSSPRRGTGLTGNLEAMAARSLADRAAFEADTAATCDALNARLRRERSVR